MRSSLLLMISLLSILPLEAALAQGPLGTNRLAPLPKSNPNTITPKINTLGWVGAPYISPDGRALYFTYSRYNFFPEMTKKGPPKVAGPDRREHNANDVNPYWDFDLYISRVNPVTGGWNTPVNLRRLNDRRDNCCVMVIPGKADRFYFQQQIPGYSIDLITISPDGDQPGEEMPEAIQVKALNTSYNEENLHVSADQTRFYFTSDRPGGFGDKDIWFSYKKGDGKMSIPSNLGPRINTKDGEDQFWMAETADTEGNREAYFTRSGSQIWQAKWNSKAGFTEPVRVEIGSQYASSPSMTADGQLLYYATANPATEMTRIMVSQRNSDGTWGVGRPVD